MTIRAMAILATGVIVATEMLAGSRVVAQPIEPPPESADGAEYVLEPSEAAAPTDTSWAGSVEYGVSASGSDRGAVERRRRVRFESPEADAVFRDGDDDPLNGGSMNGRSRKGTLAVGRLSPRWGRGLLLGAPADPWESAPIDRGRSAPFRGRTGEGVLVGAGREGAFEVLAGRFGRRDLAGSRLRHRGASLAALADRAGGMQASFGFTTPANEEGRHTEGGRHTETEIALDREGRWRAESVLGVRGGSGWAFRGRVRAGHAGFLSLGEPLRAGPAQAVSLAGESSVRGVTGRALIGVWRFRPAQEGSRLALAIERMLSDGSRVAAGFEEHRGTRRASATDDRAMRQGIWGELHAGRPSLALVVREEVWGTRALARGTVRSLAAIGVEASAARRFRLRIAHTAYDVGFGERLYWSERDPDRLVLRPASGRGRRTEVEVDAGFGSGRLGAALRWIDRDGDAPRPRWTLDWSRRSSWRKRAP